MEIIEKSKYLYTIEFKDPSVKTKILLKSLLQSKLLGAGTTITSDLNKINFNATSITTLSNLLQKCNQERKIMKLNFEETSDLLECLSKQLHYLEKHKYTFFNFSLDKILAIEKIKANKNNKYIFIHLDNDYLLEIENKYLTFTTPFDLKDKFLDPEIKKVKILPSKAHYKSIYYSLGALALSCILENFEDNNERKLEQFKCTKLYWAIIRFMDINLKKRIYIPNSI